jgi:polyadenylate-binding protein
LKIEILPYNPRDRREVRKAFNNIYVKNFPETWDEAKLKQVFGNYGIIKSLVMMKKQREGQDHESTFAFICYEKEGDKEYGPKCAMNAISELNDKEFDGTRIYVKEALKKDERESEKKKEQLRFKNSKKRCNLYVKNFPPTTTESELRDYFGKCGEIESIKLLPKEGEALYAFVCYKNPDSAALAK